ncbi:MAG TPA: helix-turn-helix domain-containing protein [Bacteroidales bacterium]|jgi:AcrR family transcriptional regulator|nr:TetR/AcrR family transcriptional regulator [Bacteroidales bacterium]MDI9573553.1 helix-turn-helix domain-containing protein [Bacteroidota bacterium]OQC61916.1 MAG: HTH-type transcriptional repressor NicS [Bacteroidetes bacterium ADurb.Bin012]MBP9511187.1 TetR/AcrR family transcriptional regulator [Bacteroidales bacterium]MBP9587601.1 TetR/AcrR family transcriptional regulator [Bacteroidales bacterium]
MKPQGKASREEILEAARKVFIENGYDGARMQEIADEAGVNKALIHYYFRSKEELFQEVFLEAFIKVVPSVMVILNSDEPLFKKIEQFVSKYLDTLNENPLIPGFILHELAHGRQHIDALIRGTGLNPQFFINQIYREIDAGKIKNCDPTQLIINILSLCIFPFVAQPILKGVFFRNREDDYARFMLERKSDVVRFIIASIRKQQEES